jgi:hypothetical protein|tara:strand:+ start:404 stop:538 length:135 start_codon:yes stop_codon:yes gene_type:complete
MAVPKFTTEEAPEVDADCHQKPARTKERLMPFRFVPMVKQLNLD